MENDQRHAFEAHQEETRLQEGALLRIVSEVLHLPYIRTQGYDLEALSEIEGNKILYEGEDPLYGKVIVTSSKEYFDSSEQLKHLWVALDTIETKMIPQLRRIIDLCGTNWAETTIIDMPGKTDYHRHQRQVVLSRDMETGEAIGPDRDFFIPFLVDALKTGKDGLDSLRTSLAIVRSRILDCIRRPPGDNPKLLPVEAARKITRLIEEPHNYERLWKI